MNEEKLMRGSAINGYLKFVKKKWGVAGLNECLASAGLDAMLKEGGYYSREVRLSILNWIAEERGMEFIKEAGKHTVLNLGLLSWLMRFANPPTVAERMKENYPEIYKYGRVEVDTSQEGRLFVKFYDLLTTKIEETAWVGVGEGFLEGTKTKGTIEVTSSQADGAEYTEFLVEYS